jgi:hypothetical protein
MSETLEDTDYTGSAPLDTDLTYRQGGGIGGGGITRPPPRRAKGFDPTTFKPSDEEPMSFGELGPPPEEAGASKGTAGDLWREVKAGADSMGADLLGVPAAIASALKAPDIADYIQKQRDTLTGWAQQDVQEMSPEGQLAHRASLMTALGLGKDTDEQGQHIPTPGEAGWTTWAAHSVASFVPDFLLAVVPGSTAAKIGVKALGLAAKGAGAARLATATTAAAFASQNSGAMFNIVHDTIMGERDETLQAGSAPYAQLRAQGMDEDEAKRELIRQTGVPIAAVGAAAGAFAGAGVGHLIKQGGAGISGQIARRAVGAAEGGVTLGQQSGVDEALQQALQQSLGQRQGYDPAAIGTAAASGGLQGAALGALFARRSEPTKQPGAEAGTTEVPPDVGAALDATKPPAPTEPPAGPPGVAAGATQGEMFQPGQMTDTGQREMYPPSQMARPTVEPAPQPAPQEAPPYTPGGAQGDLLRPSTGQAEMFEQPGAMGPPPGAPPAPPAPPGREMPGVHPPEMAAPPGREVPNNVATPGPAETAAPVRVPTPEIGQPKPSAGMSREALGDALVTQHGLSQQLVNRMSLKDRAARYDQLSTVESQARPAAVTTQPVMPAREAAEPPPGRPQPIPAEVTPKPTPPKNIAEALGGAGKAIGDNLHNYLWEKLQKGDTTELGKPSNVLLAAKHNMDTGAIKTRADFDRFMEAWNEHLKAQKAGPRVATRGEEEQTRAQAPIKPVAEPTLPKIPEVKTPAKTAAERRAELFAKRVKPTSDGEAAKTRAAQILQEAEPVSPEQARAETQRQAALDKIQGSMARVIQVRGKADVAPALRAVEREIREVIGRTDGSHEAIDEALSKYVEKAPKGVILNTLTTRAQIRDRLIRDITGREPEVSQTEREAQTQRVTEARAEVKEQPQELETHVTQGEGESQVIPSRREEMAEAGAVREEPAETAKDLEKRATQLIDRVMDPHDTMDVHQAAAEFGSQGRGRGRPRNETNRDLATRLEAEAKHAEDPDTIQKYFKLVAAAQKAAREGGEAEAGNYRSLRRLEDRIGPEYASKLRDEARKLTDPVGHAADEQQTRRSLSSELPERARSDGIDPRSSRFVEVMRDPRVAKFLTDNLARADKKGMALSLHDQLRVVRESSMMKAEAEPLRVLADWLLHHTEDIPVMSPRVAHLLGGLDDSFYGKYLTGRTYGSMHYNARNPRSTDTIVLNHENTHPLYNPVVTLLHEAMHHVTARYIDKLEPSHPDYQALQAIGKELRDQMIRARDTLSETELRNLEYAFSNPHELHTILTSDPTVHAFAASRQASPELKAELARLGFGMQTTGGGSIWRHFLDVVRKALGMRPVASASEYTMLDHVFRPIQDITTHAAQFNERLLPRDPELRASAEPNARALYSALGDARDQVAERLANVADSARSGALGRTSGDVARRVFLPAMHLDRIIERYGHLGGGYMEKFRDAGEHIGVATQRFLDKFYDRGGTLVKGLRGNDPVANMLLDAGYAKAHLGNVDPEANAHLTTPEERTRLAELERKYNNLSPADRELYQKTITLNNEMYKVERDASADRLINQLLPDATPEQRKALTDAMRSQKQLEAYINDPANGKVAEAFANAPISQKKIAKLIAEFHNQGFIKGDYFHMARHGDYVIEYGDKGTPSYGVEMFDSRVKAEARRQELLQEKTPGVQGIRERDQIYQTGLSATDSISDDLMHAIRENPKLKANANDVRDMLNRIRLQHMSPAARSKARRGYVLGASRDAARVLADDIQARAHRVGWLQHGDERAQALKDLGYHADAMAQTGQDTHTLDQVTHEFEARTKLVDTAQHGLAALSRKATAFGYVQSLMSFSRLAVETAEMHLKAGAFIGARHGFARTSLALARTMREIAPSMVGKGGANMMAAFRRNLDHADYQLSGVAKNRLLQAGYNKAEVEAFFKHFDGTGLFDNTYARTLQLMAKGSYTGTAWQRFMDINSALQHSVDTTNRIATAWTAFRMERQQRPDVGITGAIKYGEDILRKTPNFSPSNKPRIASDRGLLGKFAAPIAQFKGYGLNEYALLANLTKESMKGATPEARREARLAFMGVVAAHSLAAGVLTWLADPLRYVGGLYDLVTGQPFQNREGDVRNFISSWAGKPLGEVISRGLPHLAGMDLSHRMGVANMLYMPELKSMKPQDIATWVGTFVLGAPGQDISTVNQGVWKALHGDVLGGLKDMAPRVIRDTVKAYDLATKGVTSAQGDVLIPPKDVSNLSIANQALGFNPTQRSEKQEQRQAILQRKELITFDRGQLTHAWMNASTPAERNSVWQQIIQFNKDPDNLRNRITFQQLHTDLRNKQKAERQSSALAGLRIPKRMQRGMAEVGGFANVP